jgi:hypothetical protein
VGPTYEFAAALWRWSGNAAWHFVTLPFDQADEIDELTLGRQRGFGSVRVRVTVGSTTWETSVFPDTKVASYVLPVKKPVRVAERLTEGVPVTFRLEVLDVDGDREGGRS